MLLGLGGALEDMTIRRNVYDGIRCAEKLTGDFGRCSASGNYRSEHFVVDFVVPALSPYSVYSA
jgi:hypothetical protein